MTTFEKMVLRYYSATCAMTFSNGCPVYTVRGPYDTCRSSAEWGPSRTLSPPTIINRNGWIGTEGFPFSVKQWLWVVALYFEWYPSRDQQSGTNCWLVMDFKRCFSIIVTFASCKFSCSQSVTTIAGSPMRVCQLTPNCCFAGVIFFLFFPFFSPL